MMYVRGLFGENVFFWSHDLAQSYQESSFAYKVNERHDAMLKLKADVRELEDKHREALATINHRGEVIKQLREEVKSANTRVQSHQLFSLVYEDSIKVACYYATDHFEILKEKGKFSGIVYETFCKPSICDPILCSMVIVRGKVFALVHISTGSRIPGSLLGSGS